MSTTSAFPLWINDVPAITELQNMHRSASHTHQVQNTPVATLSSSLLNIRDLFRCNTRDPKECWHYILLSSYMTDLEWLLATVPELSAVTGKLLVLSGDKNTATLRRTNEGCYTATSAAADRANPFLAALRGAEERARAHLSGSGYGAGSSCRPVLTRERFAVVEPPLPIAYGTHHTKMAVCVNARGVRVCIFTANLLEQDWCWKTQGIYMQDFPWVQSPQTQTNDKGRDFECQLRHYWNHCGLDMHTPFSWDAAKALPLGIFNTDFLAHVDFTAAKVWLVSSVPGTHENGFASPGYRVGLCRLAEVLQKASLTEAATAQAAVAAAGTPSPVILTWQYSSQGSLNPNFLQHLEAAMCGGPELLLQKQQVGTTRDSSATPPLRPVTARTTAQEVQIIYPTEAEVRNSLEGWRGGGSLPVRLQCCHEYVNERLHRWSCPTHSTALLPTKDKDEKKSVQIVASAAEADDTATTHASPESALDVDEMESATATQEGVLASCCPAASAYRAHAMPHIKSYAAVDAARTHLLWYLLTSANLSQAAWGSLSAQTTKKAPRRLLVRSYELGVLYDRTSAVCVAATSGSCAATTTAWFSVVAAPTVQLHTAANTQNALLATPLGDESRRSSKHQCEGDTEAEEGVTVTSDASSTSGAPMLYLPCDMIRPDPYASTAVLRACRQQRSSDASRSAAAARLSCEDVPWVADIPHRGLDAYGRDVEEAFSAEFLPPLSRWRPATEKWTHRSMKGEPSPYKRSREDD